MKHLKLLTALALGVISSSSGMIQVGAATYNYFVDFATKEVADFTDYKQSFNEDTNNLTLQSSFSFTGSYRFDSCPTAFTMNVTYSLNYRKNGTGAFSPTTITPLPDFLCTTTPTIYSANVSVNLASIFLDTVVNDDVNFIEYYPAMTFAVRAASQNRTLSLINYNYYFDLNYDFNTTYLFNYFLSDSKYQGREVDGSNIANWTFNATRNVNLQYLYTTVGNDTYRVYNSDNADISNTRKKYAVDYEDQFFRGSSVGAGFGIDMTGTDTLLGLQIGDANLKHITRYYFLNVANLAQAIVDAPIISFTEEDCSGGFLDINVGCYVNNALAYIVNDAPVISDAFTLLNTGIELAAQTFGIIGNFSNDNVFGYLILVGFGFIAVKWFLKNDD